MTEDLTCLALFSDLIVTPVTNKLFFLLAPNRINRIMRRRSFIAASSAIGLGSICALNPKALAMLPKTGLGLQLWTVRNQMSEDKEATIKSVAEAGYSQVELMDVVNSKDIAQLAKDNGIQVKSAFFNWQTVVSPKADGVPSLQQVIDDAKTIGLEHLVFGYIGKSARDTSDKLKSICDSANAAAEVAKASGLSMCYHNHSFEFEKLDNGQVGFEILMDRFDKELMRFELDVFWAAIGGWDPVETMAKLGTRVVQVHLKDLKAGVGTIYDEGQVPKDAFQEVGDGTIDMEKCVEIALRNGVTQFHVEQDESPDPLASIRQSLNYVASDLPKVR